MLSSVQKPLVSRRCALAGELRGGRATRTGREPTGSWCARSRARGASGGPTAEGASSARRRARPLLLALPLPDGQPPPLPHYPISTTTVLSSKRRSRRPMMGRCGWSKSGGGSMRGGCWDGEPARVAEFQARSSPAARWATSPSWSARGCGG